MGLGPLLRVILLGSRTRSWLEGVIGCVGAVGLTEIRWVVLLKYFSFRHGDVCCLFLLKVSFGLVLGVR